MHNRGPHSCQVAENTSPHYHRYPVTQRIMTILHVIEMSSFASWKKQLHALLIELSADINVLACCIWGD